jgi:hypothetical protein
MKRETLEELVDSEARRLEFVLKRDGLQSMVEFAQRGFLGYRAVLKTTPGILTKKALIVSRFMYRHVLMKADIYQQVLSSLKKGS